MGKGHSYSEIRGLRQQDMADKLCMSLRNFQSLESGETKLDIERGVAVSGDWCLWRGSFCDNNDIDGIVVYGMKTVIARYETFNQYKKRQKLL